MNKRLAMAATKLGDWNLRNHLLLRVAEGLVACKEAVNEPLQIVIFDMFIL